MSFMIHFSSMTVAFLRTYEEHARQNIIGQSGDCPWFRSLLSAKVTIIDGLA